MEIRVDPYLMMLPGNISLVRLRERNGEKFIDLTINSISLYQLLTILRGEDPTDQPIIHRLMINTLSALEANIEKVVIDDLINETFHSRVYVKSREQIHSINAHVIDSISLAIVQDCPILIPEDLFKKCEDEMKKMRAARLPEISDKDTQMLLESIDPNKPKS